MKNFKVVIRIVLVYLALACTGFQSTSWKVKDGYIVKFSGSDTKGTFKGLNATIRFDELHPETSKIAATIDARTISTGNGLMNTHARSESGLNTDKFPIITFISTSISKTAGSFEATGNLTLKGVTKEIKLLFRFDTKKGKENFSGKMNIAPKDFGITRFGTPDEITVELTLPVTK